MMRAARTALLMLLLVTASARAQRSPLDRADSLVAAGQYALARTALLDWQRANPPSARLDAATRARALYLSARLTDDGTRAHELYLAVALSYPTAPEAPQALLRLAQALLAANEPRRALSYLERLTRDYPTAPNRPLAYLWLARAQLASGTPVAACATLNNVLRSGIASGETATLLEAEEINLCSGTPASASDSIRPAAPANPPPPATSTPLPERTTASTATDSVRPRPASGIQYAAQAGAYRNLQSAQALAAQLRRIGFDARIAQLENGTLALVRIGRFRTWGEASAQVRRIREAGFSAIIVEDAHRER